MKQKKTLMKNNHEKMKKTKPIIRTKQYLLDERECFLHLFIHDLIFLLLKYCFVYYYILLKSNNYIFIF